MNIWLGRAIEIPASSGGNTIVPGFLPLLLVALMLVSCGNSMPTSSKHTVTSRSIAHGKAASPLSLQLSLLSGEAGGRIVVQAAITSQSNLPFVIFAMQNNSALSDCQGDWQWQGAIKTNQVKTLQFSCYLPQGVQTQLLAHVQGLLNEATLNSAASIALGEKSVKGLAADKLPEPEIKSRYGKQIREYTLP